MKERIRSIMEHVQLSQQDFAARLGISPASLSSIFNGRTNPTNNHVMAVHRAFPNININWLMFGEGEMVKSSSSDENGDDLKSEENLLDKPMEVDGSMMPEDEVAAHAFFDNPTVSSAPVSASPSRMNYHGRREMNPQANATLQFSRSAINIDKRERKIKEIRVFFDDGTYESFVPSNK